MIIRNYCKEIINNYVWIRCQILRYYAMRGPCYTWLILGMVHTWREGATVFNQFIKLGSEKQGTKKLKATNSYSLIRSPSNRWRYSHSLEYP